MYQSTYYIEKLSNTFADNLAAFGFSNILASIVDDRTAIQIQDGGYAFIIVLDRPIQKEWVERARFFTNVPFLRTVDNKTQAKVIKGVGYDFPDLPEAGLNVVDYDREKRHNADYFAWVKSLSKEERRKAFQGDLRGPAAPHPEWDFFRAINPAALQVYNSLAAEWYRGREAFSILLESALLLASSLPNNLAGAEEKWNTLCKQRGWPIPKDATASQLFNPSQGKGSNYAKSQWRDPGNLKSIWLLEYLKVIGMYSAGITRLVRGAKDRKTYVLAPNRLDWTTHIKVMGQFKKAMIGSDSAVRMDILATLRYTKELLRHLEQARKESLAESILGQAANDLVYGLETAFYKSLGSSTATMNIATLRLPGWVRNLQPGTLSQFNDSIEEHVAIIASLDESKGEEYELLCLYRDFLSANDLNPFFDFTSAYCSLISHRLEKRQYVRPFTTTTLEVLFMNSEESQLTYSQILKNEGFQQIAYAIRHSTVIPQGKKARGVKPLVVIRYGLGQQLARKASYPQDFLAELAEFAQLYNAENAQLRENNREPMRKNITTADLEAITELVDRFGSRLVCNMLVAYGYAREPYKGKEEGAAQMEEPSPELEAEVPLDEEVFEE